MLGEVPLGSNETQLVRTNFLDLTYSFSSPQSFHFVEAEIFSTPGEYPCHVTLYSTIRGPLKVKVSESDKSIVTFHKHGGVGLAEKYIPTTLLPRAIPLQCEASSEQWSDREDLRP